MHVLVTAATRHGSTSEIAEAIAEGLNRRGVDADARPLDQVTNLDRFDAVVIGSAIYMGRWLKAAREFLSEHAAELSAVPVWLFSSGPLGPPGRLIPSDESTDTDRMTKLVGARGHRVLAGRLELASLNVVERAVVRAVHAPDGDCRDWDAIDALAGEIAVELNARKAA